MLENVSLALQGVWSHKLRSFLTMLGIIIGIAAIITIVSTIKGTNEQIKQNLIGQGTNVVTVQLTQDGYELDLSWSEPPQGVTPLTEERRAELAKLEGVEDVSLYHQRQWSDNVYYGNTNFSGSVYGVDSHYFSVNDYTVNYGRGFIDSDFTQHRKVALVDSSTARSLFTGENPVGRTIEMQGEPFTVVGVVSKNGGSGPVINSLQDYWMYAGNGSSSIFIPADAWSILYRYDEPQKVAVRAKNTDAMTYAGDNVAKAINETNVTSDKVKYQADDLLKQASDLQNLTSSANSQLIWIAAISLVVGGIGVMNIMLVSVTERTREIGLKIAIGAQQSRIRWQFLTEAAVLTSLGGLLGVGCGIGLAYMLSHVMGTPVAISGSACLIAVVFSMVIGIVFGLAPAVKASKLNPIEALRHE
ncbi:MAG: ABC transporter permease [Oscillospiraceae bacterium]|nr:ABC transporter permease [Oscillospiraceae bacterium]